MSNAPSKPVSFSRPNVGYFSNRPRIWSEFVVHDECKNCNVPEFCNGEFMFCLVNIMIMRCNLYSVLQIS